MSSRNGIFQRAAAAVLCQICVIASFLSPGETLAYQITTIAVSGSSSDVDTSVNAATAGTSFASSGASSALASADLASGTIRYVGTSDSSGVLSFGSAQFADSLTFRMPFASASVGVTWTLDGINSGPGTFEFGLAVLRIADVACLNPDGTPILTTDCLTRNLAFGLFPDLDGNGIPTNGSAEAQCSTSFATAVFGDEAGRNALCSSGAQSITRTGSFLALDDTTYRVDMGFLLGGRNVTQDWGNTVSLRLTLPEGVTYTSESGVLLTVPEPGTLALLSLGLAGLVVARRRRAS